MLEEPARNMDMRTENDFEQDDDYNKHITRHIPPPLPPLPQSIKLHRSDWITRLYPPTYEASNIVDSIKQIETTNLDEIIQTSEIAITWVKELHQENKSLTLDELIILTMYNFDFGDEGQNERSPQNILNHALTTRNTLELLRLRGFFFNLLVALRKLPLVEPLIQSPAQADILLTLFVPVGADGNMGGFNVNTLFKGFYQNYSKDKPLYKCSICSKDVPPTQDDLHVGIFDPFFDPNDGSSIFGYGLDKRQYPENHEYRCGMCMKVIHHPTKEDLIIPRRYESASNSLTSENTLNNDETNTIECFCADCIRTFHRQMRIEQEEDELVGSIFVCPSFVTALSDERSAKDQLRTQKAYFTPGAPPQYAGTLVKIIARREWCYNIQPYSIFPVAGKVLIEPDRVFKVLSVQFNASDIRTVNVEMLDTPLLLEDLAPLRRPGLGEGVEGKRWPSLQLPPPHNSGELPPSDLGPPYHSGLVPISINSSDYIIDDDEDVESEIDEDDFDTEDLPLWDIDVSGYIYSLVSRTPIYEFPEQQFDKEGITNIDYSFTEGSNKEETPIVTKEEIEREVEVPSAPAENGSEPPSDTVKLNESEVCESSSIKEKELDLEGYNSNYGDEFVEDGDFLDALRSLSEDALHNNIFIPQNKCDKAMKETILSYSMSLEESKAKSEERSQISIAKERLYAKEIAEIENTIAELIEESGSRTLETVNGYLKVLLGKTREVRCRPSAELNSRKLLLEVFYEKNALKVLIDIVKVFPLDPELFCNVCKIIQTIPLENDNTLIYNDGVLILLTGLEHFRFTENVCITILSTIRSCFFENAINDSIRNGSISLMESLFIEYQNKSPRVCTEVTNVLIKFSKYSEEAKHMIYRTFECSFFLDVIKNNITEFILVDRLFGLLTIIACTFFDFEKTLIESGIIGILVEFLKKLAETQATFDPLSPSYFCGLIIKLSANETHKKILVSEDCARYIRCFLQNNILSTRHCICACTALDALVVPPKPLSTINLSIQKVETDREEPKSGVNMGGISFLVLMLNASRRDRTVCTQICKTLNHFACMNKEKAKDIVRCNGLKVIFSILEQDTATPLDVPDRGRLCLNACYLVKGILSSFNDVKTFRDSDFYRAQKIDTRQSNFFKSCINEKNYDYGYDEYNEDNEDDDFDDDDDEDDEDDVDDDEDDDEDEGDFYDGFEDDNFGYDYDSFDDFTLFITEHLTFFVKVLSDVLNVHINDHDIVLTVIQIMLIISSKFILKEVIVDKESVELLAKVIYCYANDIRICQSAIFTINNYFQYNPTLCNKVDIIDMPILLLKTYVLRCDFICEKAMKLIYYMSQNSAMKRRILEYHNFLTILSVVKARMPIEPIGDSFCHIIENLVGSSKTVKECFTEHNVINLIKEMKKSATTPNYKKLINETLTILDEEKCGTGNSNDTLTFDDHDTFDDEWTGKKGGLETVNQDAMSRAIYTLIDDLGSDNLERVKTSSELLLSLVTTKGKHVDEPENVLSEDLIGLLIFKYDGVRAGFESISKNSSTPFICENILKMFNNFASSQCLCDLFIKNGGINMLAGLVRAGKYDYSTVGYACLTLCAFLGNAVGVSVAEDLRECIDTVFYGMKQVAVTEFCQRICESISKVISDSLNKTGAINKILEPQIPFIVSLIRKRIDSQAICLALCKVIYSFLEHYDFKKVNSKKQPKSETSTAQQDKKKIKDLLSLIDRNEVVRLLSQVTEIHYKSPEFCKVICKIVSILTNEGEKSDNDKGEGNSFRSELIKRGFISKLINIMLTYSSNNEVIVSSAYLLSTILHTSGSAGNNKEVRQNLATILSIFKFNKGNPATCAAFLKLLSKIDPTLLLQNDGEGIRLIISAITTHKTQTPMFETALSILCQVTTAARQRGAGPCGSTFMFAVGDVSSIVGIALNFISSRDICLNALHLLYNILTPQPPSTSSLLLAEDTDGVRDGGHVCGRKRSIELVGCHGTVEFIEEVAKRYSNDAEIGIWLGVVVTALSESEHNSTALEKKDIYHHLAEFLKQNPENETLVKNIFSAISRLCTPASFCPQAASGTRAKKTLADLVDLSLGALQRLRFQEVITVFCCCVLSTLSYNTDCCARRIAQPANIPVVVKALEHNMGSADTCNNVCIILCNALCGTDEATVRAAKIVAECGGVKLLLEVLKKYVSTQVVVKNAASALKNLSNAPGMIERIREADGVNIVGSVLRAIPQEDEQTRQYVDLIYKTIKK